MKSHAPKVSAAEYRMLAEFRYSLRRFLSFSEAAALAAGIQPTQHQALLAIKGAREPDTFGIGDLAEQLCVRHHSAVGLVDRLLEQGYVRRDADPSDGRRVRLSLTPRGEVVLEKLSAAHRDELARVGPHVEEILERLRGAGVRSATTSNGGSGRTTRTQGPREGATTSGTATSRAAPSHVASSRSEASRDETTRGEKTRGGTAGVPTTRGEGRTRRAASHARRTS